MYQLVLAMAALTMAAPPPRVVLVDRGRPCAVIVVAPKAPDSVQYAARELQSTLREATGATLPIRNVADSDHVAVYVGESATTRKLGVTARALKTDGFRITTGPRWIAIVGRDYVGPPIYGLRNPWRLVEVYNEKLKLGAFGEAGTLYGVYRLLRDVCGVRWYMPGDLGAVIPKRSTVAVGKIDLQDAPVYTYRYPWLCNFAQSEEDAIWFRRAGFGAPYPAQIIDSFGMFLKHKDAHPEYFALVGGQRDFTNLSTIVGPGNLCLSNPGVVRQWVADIDEYFDQNPSQRIFPLSPNDGMVKICECKDCQAQIDPALGPTGKFSNYVWAFVNKVARGVAVKHPDKLVGCIAYEAYNFPPTRIAKLEPNVAVMICKTRGSYADAAYARKMRETIAGWKRKTSNLYFWEYYLYSWLPWRSFPVVFPHVISDDLKALRSVGKGEFIEAESAPGLPSGSLECAGMAHMNLWVTGRLLWHPELNVDAELNDYYGSFYGPAKMPMKEFWTEAERIWMAHGQKDDPINTYKPADMAKLSGFLQQAAEKAGSDTVYGKRVRLIQAELEPARRKLSNTLVVRPPTLKLKGPVAPVKVDGSLDDPAWQGFDPFGFVDTSGEQAATKTWGYAAWDDRNLYLAFLCYEPAMGKLNASATKRDQNYSPGMWEDDSIEVFLYPDAAKRSSGFQWIINSKGLIWDARFPGDNGSGLDVKWDSHAEVQTRQDANRWIVEMRIALEDLGISGQVVGRSLAANFFRNRYCGGPAIYSCWSPTLTPQHANPGRAGVIELVPQ